MRAALIALTIIGLLAVAGYFYWINSPFYVFQQVALAVKDHDESTVRRYVDVEGLIDHLVDDVLVDPAMSTPNLSGFQKGVAAGALAVAKSNIVKGLLDSFNKSLAPLPQPAGTSYWDTFGAAPAIAAESQPVLVAQLMNDSGFKDFIKSAGDNISSEAMNLKNTAYNRMLAYIQSHPDTVPGKLMNCRPEDRSRHARALLEDYGLSVNNFKGLGDCRSISDLLGREKCEVGLRFYSPKIAHELTVELALEKDLGTHDWRILRLSNIKDVMEEVEPDYNRDVHELVEYSLSGMSNANLATDVHNIKDKLSKHPTIRALFGGFKFQR